MEILNTVFTFVSNNILTKAEFFVGLIVLVGYILLGRKWYETLAGFLKAVVGYMILNVGSAGLINTFRPILAGLNQKFHLNAVVIDPYFLVNMNGFKGQGLLLEEKSLVENMLRILCHKELNFQQSQVIIFVLAKA